MSWPPVREEYYYTGKYPQAMESYLSASVLTEWRQRSLIQLDSSESRDVTTPRTPIPIPRQYQQAFADTSARHIQPPQPNQPAAHSYGQTQQQSHHATTNSPAHYPQQQLAPGPLTGYVQGQQQFHLAAMSPSAGYAYHHQQVHQPTWGSSTNYAQSPQQPYQPAAGSTSYAQTQSQLFYHDTQKRYQEEQANFHRLREQYCRTLQYISPQYDQEQGEHHTMQVRYHLYQKDQFPSEKLSHQEHAEHHQTQAQFYGQSPSQTPQQQATAHGVLADYHQKVAAYHQLQLGSQPQTQKESGQPPRYPGQQPPYTQPSESEYTLTSGGGSTNPQPHPTITAHIYATSNIPGDPDPLDSSYRVEPNPRSYFTPGKVFHVLWTEPAGRPGSGTEYTRVQFGELAYSNIRRFVVVKTAYNACWCLPIHSYRQQAATKHHLKAEDHAVIYTDGYPKTLPGETLSKRPLRVLPDSPELKLDPTSRINFGKIYTVEHNIKVKRLGEIAEEHMHLLKSYWAEVSNPPSGNTTAQGDGL
ncbi:MAG: hypothetical protein M1840_006744 [Geoglossum simile]|nr:MAG: hypothetical protein M1840_006744 [Geoglossum simile]